MKIPRRQRAWGRRGRQQRRTAALFLFKRLSGENCGSFPATKTNLGEKRRRQTIRASMRCEKRSLERPAPFRAGHGVSRRGSVPLIVFSLFSSKPGGSRRSPRRFGGGSGCWSAVPRAGRASLLRLGAAGLCPPRPSRCSPRAGGLRSRLLPESRGSAPPSGFSASYFRRLGRLPRPFTLRLANFPQALLRPKEIVLNKHLPPKYG